MFGIKRTFQTLFSKLDLIIQNQKTMALDLSKLQAAVAQETSVDQSVVTLLKTLADELAVANSNNDQVAIDGIVQTMNQNATTLANAITQNTPAAPAGDGSASGSGDANGSGSGASSGVTAQS